HTRFSRDWSSDVCSSDLRRLGIKNQEPGAKAREQEKALVLAPFGKGTWGICSSPRLEPIPRSRRFNAPPATLSAAPQHPPGIPRSEERRVGKEARSWWPH